MGELLRHFRVDSSTLISDRDTSPRPSVRFFVLGSIFDRDKNIATGGFLPISIARAVHLVGVIDPRSTGVERLFGLRRSIRRFLRAYGRPLIDLMA